MKPPRFEYFAPRSLEEALTLLEQGGFDAKILAGGQSLIPLLNMRLAHPKTLIDINRVRELDYVRVEDGELVLGALVRHATLQRSSVVRKHGPLLSEAAGHVGHVQIRSRGTLGGSIAHADPAAELPTIVSALGGSIVVQSSKGQRTVPASEFFLGFLMTALEPDEVVVQIRVPAVAERTTGVVTGSSFMKVARRSGDFALCAVASQLQLDDSHRIRDVAIGLSGVGPGPIVPEEAAEMLIGERLTETTLTAVADHVADVCDPASDLHADADYRRHLARVMTRRALETAWNRAMDGGAVS